MAQDVSQQELTELKEEIESCREELQSAHEQLMEQNQKKTSKSFGEPEIPAYTEAPEYGE